jgi:hypothetical protein
MRKQRNTISPRGRGIVAVVIIVTKGSTREKGSDPSGGKRSLEQDRVLSLVPVPSFEAACQPPFR